MDNGNGQFREMSQEEFADIQRAREELGDSNPEDGAFMIGDSIRINGSLFRILSLDKFTGIMTLKLRPRPGEKLKTLK